MTEPKEKEKEDEEKKKKEKVVVMEAAENDNDDGDMTPNERLEWLRARGVVVETPEERRVKRIAQIMEEPDETNHEKNTTTNNNEEEEEEEEKQQEQQQQQQQRNENRKKAPQRINQPPRTESRRISFVLVPHDTSRPLKELTFDCPIRSDSRGGGSGGGGGGGGDGGGDGGTSSFEFGFGGGGDALAEYLKPMFAALSRGREIDLELFREQSSKNPTLLGTDGTALPEVSEETLRRVASSSSSPSSPSSSSSSDGMGAHVEIFPLVKATESNDYTAVNIYLDEVGMLKRLPSNPRATEYAARAGFRPSPTFYGDVFLGRVKSRPVVTNLPFTVGQDTALDAPWLLRGVMENVEHQMAMNRMTGQQEARQPSYDGEDGVQKVEQDGVYSWTQTSEELELTVPLLLYGGGTEKNKGVVVATKDVTIKFLPQSIRIRCRGESILDLKLFDRIDPDGCTWTLENKEDPKRRSGQDDRRQLVVTMEKAEEALWPRIKN